MKMILTHFPPLQILIPFIGALLTTLSFNRRAAQIIAISSAILSLILSIYVYISLKLPVFYAFGNWPAPIGIEYRIDNLNQPVIIFFNSILLFFLINGYQLINLTITRHIETNKQHIFYSLLLFAHVGFLGVVSTNDLFNIYVFIEISSLATYVLISKGSSSRALIGAFDYLLIGTIGATLILIGIGFLFALTGSLNITDIANILAKLDSNRLIITAIAFFITGAILKMAFFPMHFWLLRAYLATAPFMLTYFGGISSIFGIYIILRFVYFVSPNEYIWQVLFSYLKPFALITIICCSYLALRALDFKKVIIYSSAAQIGYIFLLLTINDAKVILFQLLVLDAINKIALFTIVAHLQNANKDLTFANFPHIEGNLLFKILIFLSLIFSSGLPITSMFLVKINMLSILIDKNLLLEFILVTFASGLGLLYHLKLGRAVFFGSSNTQIIRIETKLYGLIVIILIQIFSLIYINDIAMIAACAESTILN